MGLAIEGDGDLLVARFEIGAAIADKVCSFDALACKQAYERGGCRGEQHVIT